MTDKKHFTNLDSLRGIAAIMVVILHSFTLNSDLNMDFSKIRYRLIMIVN